MRPSALLRVCAPALLSAALACDAPKPAGPTDLGLLQVVAITLESVNPYYPQRPPDAPLNSLVCQVWLDVKVILPDACTGFGSQSGLEREGNTFRFQVHGIRRPGACGGGGPSTDSLGLCLPALGAEPPPPPLAPGHYVVIVNSFTGGFDIP